MFSVVHPTTDIAKILRHVRFVPKPDVGGTSWRGPEAEELGRRLLASEILLGQISAENSDSASFLL